MHRVPVHFSGHIPAPAFADIDALTFIVPILCKKPPSTPAMLILISIIS